MDNPELGALGRLPREIRGMLLDIVVDPVQTYPSVIRVRSARQAKRKLHDVAPPKIRERVSHQLSREYFEAAPRQYAFQADSDVVNCLAPILKDLGSIADIESHTRSIGVWNWSGVDGIKYRRIFSLDEMKVFRPPRHCHERYRIPASRLFTPITYFDSADFLHDLFDRTKYRGLLTTFVSHQPKHLYSRAPCLKIVVGDKHTSMENLDKACKTIEARLEDVLNALKLLELTSHTPIYHKVKNAVEEAFLGIKEVTTAIKERHRPIIDRMMQF